MQTEAVRTPPHSRRFQAAIFDLDGVITRTARVHAEAWKAMFDKYLQERQKQGKPGEHRPFDEGDDYRRYVDGKPRYDGVKSFLESREIELPLGNLDDPPNAETIRGLGNRKNEIFRQLLKEQGPEVFASSEQLVRQMRKEGWKTAVVSSSKNCVAVLEAAQLLSLFDTKVDGLDAEELQLKGKPAPDIFLEAAGRLSVDIGHCVGFEDALAGVESAFDAGCGLVVGVRRNGSANALGAHGADVVVNDLGELSISGIHEIQCQNSSRLPNAIEGFQRLWGQLNRNPVVLFLDYDGTLSPIVAQPEDADLSPGMRDVLQRLRTQCPVAIISGRDCRDILKRVDIAEFYYAGSHGFEIRHPDGRFTVAGGGESYLDTLDSLEQRLKQNLAGIHEARVERKRFSVAVHYRNVAEGDVGELSESVDAVASRFPKFRRSDGKRIVEFHPGVEWHKGKAVEQLLEGIDPGKSTVRPIYLGDDTTDEDGFRAVQGNGVGIYVRTDRRSTCATYALEDTAEVAQFLEMIIHAIEKRSG